MKKQCNQLFLFLISLALFGISTTSHANLNINSSNGFISYKNHDTLSSRDPLLLLSSHLSHINSFRNDLSQNSLDDSDEIIAEIQGKALVYPNPFRSSEGGELGYYLSKDMHIEVRYYDMKSLEIKRLTYELGEEGGKAGYNRVPIHSNSLGATLPSGLYYYIILNDGEFMGKGKFVVKS